MPLIVQCPSCSRRLKADEKHRGRTCKCPSCGHKIEIPPHEAGSEAPHPPQAPLISLARDPVKDEDARQAMPSQPGPDPPGHAPRAKGPTILDHLKNIRILGIGTRGLIIIAVIVGASLGTYYWWKSRPGITVGEPRVVDSYLALEYVRFPHAIEIIDVTPIVGTISRPDYVYDRSILFGGECSVALVRPCSSGKHLVVPVSVTQKYLFDNTPPRKWAGRIAASHFELRVGDTKLTPILLLKPFSDFVRVDTNPGGGDDKMKALLSVTRMVPSYPDLVERESGLRLTYEKKLDDRLLEVRWNDGSEAWYAATELKLIEAYFDSHKTKLNLLFDLPENPGRDAQLLHFGKPIAAFPIGPG